MSDDLNAALNARIDAALRDQMENSAASSLEADYQARVAMARQLSQDMSIEAAEIMAAIPRGPAGVIKRLLHALVIHYVNRLAGRIEASQRQQLEALAVLRDIVARQQAEIDALRGGSVGPRA